MMMMMMMTTLITYLQCEIGAVLRVLEPVEVLWRQFARGPNGASFSTGTKHLLYCTTQVAQVRCHLNSEVL